MRIFYLIGLILLLQIQFIKAQESNLFPFTLEGFINADTGFVQLDMLYLNDYYPSSVVKMVANIKNERFYFSGYIPYPQAFTLKYGKNYYTKFFVIEPGSQTISCNIDSAREVPIVDNLAMKEYENEYKKIFELIRRKRTLYNIKEDSLAQLYQRNIPDSINLKLAEELKGYYMESDSVLLGYVTKHPNSYVALWNFIYLFGSFGYETIFDSIVENISDSLKNTYAGKELTKNVKIASSLDYGKKFPEVVAIDMHDNKLNYSSILKNEYILIDFWFSSCGPCIAQFEYLKEIYEKYKGRGFEIIGISTDNMKFKSKWLDAIQKYQILWPQYWDKDGKESSQLSINKFPTNFLLDSNGNIIKKDLSPVELDDFLSRKIR